uniref:FBD domain-containing protein n=1 Tax=Aegilops tauschii TaxID=37682 RepID=N1QQ78_AEGTA
MWALPNLESLASRDTTLHFDQSALFPCLRQCNHTTRVGLFLTSVGQPRVYIGHQLELGSFLGRTPYITNLVLRFTGPRRWIVPPSGSSSPLLPQLRKLLVADVPSSWDVSWPCLLLEMAPSLETLHIHIAPCNERPGHVIPWEPTELRRHHLKELVVAGFQGTKRQICFVKFVVGVSTSLRRVALFRNGRAEDKGHWDWEMVTEQHSWTNRQKNATQKKIMDGVSFSRPPPQFVFG